jgi:hypothetical protein
MVMLLTTGVAELFVSKIVAVITTIVSKPSFTWLMAMSSGSGMRLLLDGGVDVCAFALEVLSVIATANNPHRHPLNCPQSHLTNSATNQNSNHKKLNGLTLNNKNWSHEWLTKKYMTTSKFLGHFILLKLTPTVLITITLFAPFSTFEIDPNI